MNWHSGRRGSGVGSITQGREGRRLAQAESSVLKGRAHSSPGNPLESLINPAPPPPTHSLPVTRAQTAAKAQFKPRTLPPRPSLPAGNPHHHLSAPSEQILPRAATKGVGYTRHPSPGKQAPPHHHGPLGPSGGGRAAW